MFIGIYFVTRYTEHVIHVLVWEFYQHDKYSAHLDLVCISQSILETKLVILTVIKL